MEKIINNLEYARELNRLCWKDSDMYCVLEIRQRFKDNNNVLDSTNKSIFYPKLNKLDDNDNMIALAVIKGETIDQYNHRLNNPILYIFPQYRKFLNCGEYLTCDDNRMGNVIRVCETFNARAYLGHPRLSYTKNKSAQIPNFNVPIRIKRILNNTDKPSRVTKFTYFSNYVDKTGWFYGFIDVDDIDTLNQVKDILEQHELKEYDVMRSHNGYHVIILWDKNGITQMKAKKETKDKLNTELLKLGTQYVVGFGDDPKVKMESRGFSKILLYSSTGDGSKNVPHPEWMRGMIFPCNE